MSIKLIELTNSNFDFVKEVYDFYIQHTTSTFHTERISIEELKTVICVSHPKYKSYIIEYEGKKCGYCYISQYKKRQAYDRTAEITIYLKQEFSGKGIGIKTLNMLEEIAKNNGICVLIGTITSENNASIKLFEKCGYEKCAHFRKVGIKFNRLLDVVAYQKSINE